MILRNALSLFALVVAISPGGCARDASRAVPQSAAELPVSADSCPLAHIRGVEAHATDVPRGIAIAFSAPDRAVDLVRGNVHAMAAASDQQGDAFVVCPCGLPSASTTAMATPSGDSADLGRTSMQPPSPTPAPLVSALVKDTPTGATLVLAAMDDADAEALRASARRSLDHMAGCLSR